MEGEVAELGAGPAGNAPLGNADAMRAALATAKRRTRIQSLARISLLSALAMLLSYVETMVPIPVAVPGIKLGLANVAVLVALYVLNRRQALGVALVKVVAAGFLFGSPTMLAYSAGGTAAAVVVMVAMRLVPGMGPVPISMASAIAHNAGQLAVASVLLGSPAVFATLPVLAVAACVTGALTGAVAQGVVNVVQLQNAQRPVVEAPGFSVEPGQVVALVGKSGCGKTSFALQIAGLAAQQAPAWAAALQPVGLVLQNPESQIVARTVEDDVAFGLENQGMCVRRMRAVVSEALQQAGLPGFEKRPVESLSGGQKQKLATAGVLALAPRLVVFDEASAMLDPAARAAFWRTVESLQSRGVAVLLVTHSMQEAFRAQRVAVLSSCRLAFFGTPSSLAGVPAQQLDSWGVYLPERGRVAQLLHQRGIPVAPNASAAEIARALGYNSPHAAQNESNYLDDNLTHFGAQTAQPQQPVGQVAQSRGFGVYRPGSSFAHALDPRVKIGAVALYLVAAFWASSAAALACLAVAAAVILAACKAGPAQALRLLKPFAALMVFVGVFDALFTTGTIVWWQAGPVCLSAEGLAFAAASLVRFACVLLATGMLMQVTPSTQLVDGAALLLAPLQKLGLPVQGASLATGLTFRFIPVLVQEFQQVKTAQLARGACFSQPSFAARLKAYVPVLVPVFAGALHRSEELALALENRWYGREERTCYREYRMKAADFAALGFTAALVVAAAVL